MTPEEDLYSRLSATAKVAPTAPSEGSAAELDLIRGDPDANAPVTVRNLFTHQDTHPIVIDFALMRAFGLDWLGWETPTIWAEIQRVFQSQISEHARAKVQTVKTCHVSNLPWEKWQVFEKIVQGLNNNIPRFDTMQAPTLEQLYVAIDILDELRKMEFSDEVKLYMAAAVLHEDVLFVPPPLDFIQMEIAQPHYRCGDCGNEDLALFHDGICDTCTQKWTSGSLGGRPDQALFDAGRGRNLTTVLRFNPDPVQELWERVKTTPSAEVDPPETAEGTQVAKLLIARDYMNVRRRQMVAQLTSLKSWLGSA